MKRTNGNKIADAFLELTESFSILEAIAIILETEVAHSGFIQSLELKRSFDRYLKEIEHHRKDMRVEILKILVKKIDNTIKQAKMNEYIS